MKLAISDYKTGEEIWRGEVDRATWDKIKRCQEHETGAFSSELLLDQGLLTGQKVPAVVFAEEI